MSDQQDTDRLPTVSDRPRDRAGVDVATAARQLGISHDAVRGRLRRKSLAGELQPNGQWLVYLDAESDDRPPTGEQQATSGQRQAIDSHTTVLIEALQAQVSDLQRRLDRQDVHLQSIIAKLPNPDATMPAMIEAETHQNGSGAIRQAATGADVPAWVSFMRRMPSAGDFAGSILFFVALVLTFTYVGAAVTSAGRFFSWENLGKAAIIATVLVIPLTIIGIVVSVWLAHRSPPAS